MSSLFSMAALSLKPHNDVTDKTVPSGMANLQSQVTMLENNLAKALMINEALWEILRDRLNLTEDDLNSKLYDIDMRDGKLDGKNQSPATKCPQCQRTVSSRHAACLYCGHIMDQSVFHMT